MFGLPMDFVTDQDPLFHCYIHTQFCISNNNEQSMSSTYHPESDGQSKFANKAIFAILSAKLLDQGGSWLEKIPHVAQAINSSVDTAKGCTCNTLVLRFASFN